MLSDGYADAVTRERAHDDVAGDESRGDLVGAVAGGQPDEVALGVGHLPALGAEPGDEARAAGDNLGDAFEQLGFGVEARDGRVLRRSRHGEGYAGDAGRIEHLLVADRVADAQACESVRLREGAQDDDVRMPVEDALSETVDRIGRGDELGVCLVENDQDVGGDPLDEGRELAARDDRTGRVVGGANDDRASAIGDGIRHRIEVVTRVGGERDRDSGRSRDERQARVRLERPPRVDDLVVDGCRGEDQLMQDRHAAGGDVHLVGLDAVPRAEALAQPQRGGVGVTVDRRDVPHRLDHRRQRVEGVLVARQLERIGSRLLALAVRRERGDGGADAGKDRVGHEDESTSARGKRSGRVLLTITTPTWKTGRTMRFIIRVVVNAFALWVVTLIPALQVSIVAFPPGETLQLVLTLLAVAAIFALVNTIIGTVVKIVAFPLYILTLGLIGFVINGFLLWLTAWITSGFGWGLTVGHFWWGVVAALIISIINGIFGFILRPQAKKQRRRD
ncbi:mycobacterial 4 TMS phage holin, superfamily IV domain-containing protein [Ditylenchus destructor]|nr:mycobacterial 4 TMS phage holin, superfamily IV domain-containing protein [Ditylenchus destructor]